VSGALQILAPEIEYCAFMVAIIFVRIVVTSLNNRVVRSPLEIAEKLNSLNLSKCDIRNYEVYATDKGKGTV
jgi:hypothetical protein